MHKIDLTNLPSKPGCYLYFDSNKKIIYIGKAKNLKKRVSNYFQKDLADHDPKTASLVQQIVSMDFIITDTEVEALLLESRLIKQYKPKYNIDLKNNERYAYIKITNESTPRLITARKKEGNGQYFGPFVDGYSRALTVKVLNEAFQLRTCKTLPKTACLNYHLGLCSGPCQPELTGVTAEKYKEQISRAKKFLKGDISQLQESLKVEMGTFAKSQNFEMAKQRRDQLRALDILSQRQKVDVLKEFDQDVIGLSTNGKNVSYFIFNITRGTINKKDEFTVEIPEHSNLQKTNQEFIMQYYSDKTPPKEIICSVDFVSDIDYPVICEALTLKVKNDGAGYEVILTIPQQGDKKKLLELATTNADYALAGESPVLIKLKERLKLPTIPYDIECYDISNLGNDYIVGAKVHFTNAQPNKDNYRRFRIKWNAGQQNDFAAMYEVIKRRFYKVKIGEDKLPDLVVIDGGKGQLGAALDALRELELRVPIISLAKREEEIYFPGLTKPLNTKNNVARDPDIRLLQQIRDETHRFVITYHRHLRDTKSFSDLEKLEGSDFS